MGAPNNALNVYMNKPDRIRSVLEYYLKEQLPKTWECTDVNGFYAVPNTKGRLTCRQRDILKRIKWEYVHFLLGIENQMAINLIFPWRLMDMDSLTYEYLIEHIQQKNRRNKVTYHSEDDFQYRYLKTDKLEPLVTLVLYWGKIPWKEPLSLKSMLDASLLPPGMHKLLQDYKINVISMRSIPQNALDEMDSDLKYVLGMLKCSRSQKQYLQYMKEHEDFFRHTPKSAADVLSTLMHLSKVQKYLQYIPSQNEKEAEADMCKAIDDIIKDATKKGVKLGEAKGKHLGVEETTLSDIRKLMKNLKMSAEQAMVTLEIPEGSRIKYLKRI